MGPPDGFGNPSIVIDEHEADSQHQSAFARRFSTNNRNNSRIRSNWNRLSRFPSSGREDNDREFENRPRNERRQEQISHRNDNYLNENFATNRQREINSTVDSEINYRTPRATLRPNIISYNVNSTPSIMTSIPIAEIERTSPLQVLSSASIYASSSPSPEASHNTLSSPTSTNRSLLELETSNTPVLTSRGGLFTQQPANSLFDIEMDTSVRRMDSPLLHSYQPSPPRSLVSLASLAYRSNQALNLREEREHLRFIDNGRNIDSTA